MAAKKVSDLCLLPVREAAKGFLISLRASNRYSDSYLAALETALAFLADYSEGQGWPGIEEVTVSHIEEYLLHFQTRPRWFGERGQADKPPSQSYIETQYRRLKRFFNWLVERGHVETNPLNLIPHPHIDEKTIPIVSERQSLDLLRLVDPRIARTAAERFRIIRNRAIVYILIDTPARRGELASMKLGSVDIDTGSVLVMGKGRRERWIPLGNVAQEALWEYLQHRAIAAGSEEALWVSERGKPMLPNGIYTTIKKLGDRAGIPNLHTHRFRHTYAVNALRGGMPERILMLAGGWKRIPETYFRTLGAEDVARFHRQISPADKLKQSQRAQRPKFERKARGKL